MKILNFGSINADCVYKVPHMVRPGETLSSFSLDYFAGGKGANQSVALAKTGVEVYHAGKIGNDGSWLKEQLGKFRVKTDFIRRYDGPTGHAIIQVTPQGENSIVLFGGGNQQITGAEVQETLDSFETGDYLVLQNEINITPQIIEEAHRRGMKICLNPAPYGPEVRQWPLKLVDILILNETEAMDLIGVKKEFSEALDELTEQYPDTEVVMTVGKAGAYFGKKKERIFVEGRSVKTVDTTAAGDTFLGYYLASRMGSADPETAMKRANLAASVTVSRPGAMESIPTAVELAE